MSDTFSFTDLEAISNNPTRVIPTILSKIEDALSASDVAFNSPSHPFIVALDMIAGQTWGLINRHEDAISKLYPFHARDMSDIGRNMSDEDWYGMFANPSSTLMAFILPTSEIERLAVDYTEQDGSVVNTYRKLVIPKDTRIKVVGTYYMVETPIEIRLMPHGGHSVVYDSLNISPFNPISTNILEQSYVMNQGIKFLRIEVPVRQLNATPIFNVASTLAGGLKDTFTYDDNLYGIRAFFTAQGSTVKKEISIVYNNQAYDRTKLTILIDLDPSTNKFTYEMPEVYLNNGTGIGSVSLIVYTSKGDYSQDIKTIQTNQHQPEYLDYNYDNGNLDKYSSPIRNLSDQFWQAIQAVSGGSNPRSFTNVRNAVIYGSRRNSLPITPNQFSFNISDYGYSPVESIDYVANRLYRVTKDLPLQTNKDFNSSIGVYVGDLNYTLNELIATGVVYNNGERVTIPAKTLVRIQDSANEIVTSNELAQIQQLVANDLVDYLKANRLVYLPFHYVLDATQSQIDVRLYTLNNPSINYRRFLYENVTFNLEVGVGSATLTANKNGYLLRVSAQSGSEYKALSNDSVGLQLCYNPPGTTTMAAMAGVLVGMTSDGERTWEFNIPSTFDVDSSDQLHLSGFTQFGAAQQVNLTNLTDDFSLLFLKKDPDASGVSDSDQKINRTLFNSDFKTIVESTFNISFGTPMDGMFTRARPLLGQTQYQVWDKDVPLTYGVNTYQRDKDNQLVFGNDNLPILLNSANDVVKDGNGNPIILYPKGTFKKDVNGNPIPVKEADISYHYTIIGFDGSYYFSTDSYDSDYTSSIDAYLRDIVMKDMKFFTAQSLDETKLMFQPKVRIGSNNVIINEGQKVKLNLDFSFRIVYYLDKTGFANDDLKSALRTSTPGVLNSELEKDVVSISSIQTALNAIAGANVVDIKVVGFLDNTEIDVASRGDSGASFSIRKLLELTTEGVLSVKEDVNIDFKQHTPKT